MSLSNQNQSQQNLSLVKKLFEEVYTKGNLSELEDYFTNNVLLDDPASPHIKEGLKAYRELENDYLKAFPSKKAKLDEIFAVEDKVVARWTLTTQHKGALQGIAPTNKEIKISGISIYQFAHGKISKIHQNWDRLGLLEQIGEIEPSHALHR